MTRCATDREVLLFHHCTLRGFRFGSATVEKGGPLVGVRCTEEWVDTIHIEGLSGNCAAWRQRPGERPLVCRIEGDAETVMAAAIGWGATRVVTG